jgi:hypothetical protein
MACASLKEMWAGHREQLHHLENFSEDQKTTICYPSVGINANSLSEARSLLSRHPICPLNLSGLKNTGICSTVSDIDEHGYGSIVEESVLSLKSGSNEPSPELQDELGYLSLQKKTNIKRLFDGEQIKIFSDVFLNGWSFSELINYNAFRRLNLHIVHYYSNKLTLYHLSM